MAEDRSRFSKLDILELQILWRGAALDVMGFGRPDRYITGEISEFVGSGDELVEPDWSHVPLAYGNVVDTREVARRRKTHQN